MTSQKPDMLRPALLGGLVGAVLSIVPPLCCLNVLCCLDYVLGGVVAGALYARRGAAMSWYAGAGEGATVGALSGGLAGFVTGALSSVFLGLSTMFDPGKWNLDLDKADQVQEVLRWGGRWNSHQLWRGLHPFASVTSNFVGHVGFGLVAGLVGGILGVLMFRGLPPVAGVGRVPPGPPPAFPGTNTTPPPPPPAAGPVVDVTPGDDEPPPPTA